MGLFPLDMHKPTFFSKVKSHAIKISNKQPSYSLYFWAFLHVFLSFFSSHYNGSRLDAFFPNFRGIFINKVDNQTLWTSQLWHVFPLFAVLDVWQTPFSWKQPEIFPFVMRDHENIIVKEWSGVGRGICSPNSRGEYFHFNNLNMILEECFQLKGLLGQNAAFKVSCLQKKKKKTCFFDICWHLQYFFKRERSTCFT